MLYMTICLELIQRNRVTSLFVVPPALLALVNVPGRERYDTSSLQDILSAAAPLPPEVARMASREFNVPVLQGYGMTQTTAAANVDSVEGARPSSVGRPLADTEEKMCHMFGVVKNKIMYGKKVKGIERSTFLIGPDGLLVQEWRGLKVPGHVDEVLKAVKSIKALKKAA